VPIAGHIDRPAGTPEENHRDPCRPGCACKPEESDVVEGSMPARSDRPYSGKPTPPISHHNHTLGGIRVQAHGDGVAVRGPPMAGEILRTDQSLNRTVTHDAEVNDVDIGALDLLPASGLTRRHANVRSERPRVGSDRSCGRSISASDGAVDAEWWTQANGTPMGASLFETSSTAGTGSRTLIVRSRMSGRRESRYGVALSDGCSAISYVELRTSQ